MLGRLEQKWIVAIVGVFSIFMELLDTTIINVAIPTLAREFEVGTASTIQWVITGYLLSLAVFIPVSGWAGDRFGTKRVFMFAVSVFTLASLLCALSWNIESMIAFRVLQGVGGGMLSPVAFAMVWRAFPPEERSRAAGIMVVPAAAAPASGPLLGGWLVEYASWHWIFLVNLPIGIAALAITLLGVEEHREEKPGRFDPAGFVLSGLGLALVMYALAEAGENGFGDARVQVTGILGLAVIAVYAMIELRVSEPMLDLRIYRNALFRACNLAWLVTMFAGGSMIFLVTLELQAVRGLTAFESGLTTFPMALGVMFVAQPASRIYRVVGPRRMILAGLVFSAFFMLALRWVELDTNLWWIRLLMFGRGVAFGVVLVPLQAATYATVAPAETGRATALYNAASQVATSFGVAVAASLLTREITQRQGPGFGPDAAVSAYHDVFLILGLLALAGSAVAFLISDRDAAPTMRGQETLSVEGPDGAARSRVAAAAPPH
jgi:EmrB/QacA subfamily drug resistance transporter